MHSVFVDAIRIHLVSDNFGASEHGIVEDPQELGRVTIFSPIETNYFKIKSSC